MNFLKYLMNEMSPYIRKGHYFGNMNKPPKGVMILDSDKNPPEGFLYIGTEEAIKRECKRRRLSDSSVFLVYQKKEGEQPEEINLITNYYNIFYVGLPLEQLCNKLNVILADYYELEYSGGYVEFAGLLYNILLKPSALRYRSIHDYKLAKPVHEFVQFIVMHFEDKRTLSIYSSEIEDFLEQILAKHNYTIFQGKVVGWYSSTERHYKLPEEVEDGLNRFAIKYNCKIGIGAPIRNLEYMRTNFYIIDYMLRVASEIAGNKGTYLFYEEKNAVYTIIDLCEKKFKELFFHDDILYLAHPGVLRLHEYDMEKGTKFCDFLSCYLNSNGNLSETASKMFVHRNTAKNWLDIVREIMDDDIDDMHIRFIILLSLHLIEYKKI